MRASVVGQNTSIEKDGIALMGDAIYNYLSEIEKCRSICERHITTAAVHDVGKTLQIFRMFHSDEITIGNFRKNNELLPDCKESSFWKTDGVKWSKMEQGIMARMKKARNKKELLPILTRGVDFEGTPILIHAYKFEADRAMKIELLPLCQTLVDELPIQTIAQVLLCHEFLLPDYIAKPMVFGQYHDGKTLTLLEYLHRKMPTNLYATQCLQRVSCHAGNVVGSRDTLCEHQVAIASHSNYGQTQAT